MQIDNRPKFIPLFEANREKAVIGEIIMDPWSGHISTRNPKGNIVSATKILDNKINTIEDSLKNTPNATSLNAVFIREEFFLVDSTIEIDPTDQKQIFFLKEGKYELGLNRLKAFVGASRLTAAAGTLIEVSETSFKLADNLAIGTSFSVEYFEVIKSPTMAYGLNVIIQNDKPEINDDLKPGTIWISQNKSY